MEEKLYQYCWKHKLFPLKELFTVDGEAVEVIDTGLQNWNQGPDFFNAKIKIGGQIWVGNVELHIKSSNWYLHGHDKDEAYENVILHVVTEADREVYTLKGERLPQMVLGIPDEIRQNYEELLREDKYPRCYRVIESIPTISTHAWLAALSTERLERKVKNVKERLMESNGSWEDACFRTLARCFGFGVNSEAFEEWARRIPLHAVDHHRDDIFQIEAIFMGQAGLLQEAAAPAVHREETDKDLYYHRLRTEYDYLRHKFGLQPMDYKMWNFLRLRPQNFPYIKISQLANLYYSQKAGLSKLLECKDIKELKEALKTESTEYWQTHYVFGQESEKSSKKLSAASLNVLLINAIIPLFFAYGRYKRDDGLCDKALDLLEELKPEDNNIVRLWAECGLSVDSACDTQALIQLKKEYCDKKECLRCRFGYQYLAHPSPLRGAFDYGQNADV